MALVLVIGETGQLARALMAAPSRLGMTLEHTRRSALDLAAPETVEAYVRARRPAAVINAAAYNAVDRAESEPEAAYAVNAASVRALARACAALDAPFVHVSTDYVFDGAKGAPYVETDAANPVNAYGRSKRAGEEFALSESARCAVIRTSWVHSASGNGFVQTVARLARERGALDLVEDQLGRPTWAPDLAEAALLVLSGLLDRDSRAGGIFHVAGAGDATRADWGALVLELLAAQGGPVATFRRISSAEFATSAPRPPDTRLDCPRFASLAGHGALRDWRDGVARTVAGMSDIPTLHFSHRETGES